MALRKLSQKLTPGQGTWGHIDIRHFHPNSHECYGIFRGTSTLLVGQIEAGQGSRIDVAAGDVIVLPAGTAHSSLESSSDYRYIGVYPTVSSRHAVVNNEGHSLTVKLLPGLPTVEKRIWEESRRVFPRCY